MPFSSEKDAVIAIVKQNECVAAKYIEDNATTYEELLDALFEFAKSFDCDPTYLDTLLSLITPSELINVGVYYNQTLASVTNPKYIAKSTITTVTINSSFSGSLEITYNSQITELNLSNADMENIVITGGAVVEELTVPSDSTVEAIMIKACNQYRGKLALLKGPENVADVVMDEDAIYGGSECITVLP